MSTGATVDHKSLHVQFGPLALTEGRAKGDYLQVIYNSEAYTEHVGIDEEGFWVANGDLSARIDVTLVQTSHVNGQLSKIHMSDRGTPGGLVLPLIIEEKNGTTVYAAARARIVKMVDGVWSDGAAVRKWTLSTIVLIPHVGGVNATPIDPNPLG